MIKEYFTNQKEESSIKIEDSKIKSYKNTNITEKSVRVFDVVTMSPSSKEKEKKVFALAAAKGNVPDCELENKAIDLLSMNMPYDYELEKNLKAEFIKEKLNIENLESFTNKALKDLKSISKNFVLSGSSSIDKSKIKLRNNLDLDLSKQLTMISLSLSMKLKGSGNIMDSYTGISGFDITDEEYQDFMKDSEFMAKACLSKEVKLKSKPYKILFQSELILGKLDEDINGVEYEEKTSLLTGKLNKQIFNENINIVELRVNDDTTTFYPFDHEGIVNTYGHNIVKNGVLKTILYNKKYAKKYGKVSTGNGFRNYNSNPYITNTGLNFGYDVSHRNCTDLISDDIVIIPFISSGGDYLPNGNYSLPVQMAFVFENGKFIGKAPQFTLTGNYLKSLNKDFIALGNNDIMKNLLCKTMLMCYGKVNVQ